MLVHCIAGGGAAGGDLDFLVDRGEVVIDSARTDYELLGDLCIGQSLRQQAQDLEFTGGQAVGIGDCWFRW